MRKKIAVIAVTSGLALTGGLLVGPGIALAEDAATATSPGGRLTAIKEALKGLVTDKTLTQAQADKVAATLDTALPRRGPGHGHAPRGARLRAEAVADVLGISVAELRAQQQAGKTLAQIAAAKGVSRETLIAGLVRAAEAELAAAVADGRLTQSEADTLKAGLRARITEKVDRVGPGRGRHGAPAEGTGGAVTPSSTARTGGTGGTAA